MSVLAAAASQHGFLFDLPHAALYAILHRAGPRSRELCKALRHVYGPLPRLTPRGVETIRSLLSVLARDHHRQLRALDLRHVIADLLAGDSLAELCKALPSLRALRLPSTLGLALPIVAAATSHLRSLEALHMPCLAPSAAGPSPEHIQGWSLLLELTLPLGAALGPTCADLHRATRLSTLSLQGHSSGIEQHYVFDVPVVASLAAPLPSLRALELGMVPAWFKGQIAGAAQLRRLARLTSLSVQGVEPEEGTSTGQLLQHVGALTNLRSLRLRLRRRDGWAPAEQGWLTGLPHLTSLRVAFSVHGGRDTMAVDIRLGGALDEVASAVANLPALQELHIDAYNDSEVVAVMSAAAFARVASAASSLRLLHLGDLMLPATALTDVLLQLTALTSLRLDSAVHAHEVGFSWLTALTGLWELWHGRSSTYDPGECTLPCELLACLSNLRALRLNDCWAVDGPYVTRLCASMRPCRT